MGVGAGFFVVFFGVFFFWGGGGDSQKNFLKHMSFSLKFTTRLDSKAAT